MSRILQFRRPESRPGTKSEQPEQKDSSTEFNERMVRMKNNLESIDRLLTKLKKKEL